MAAIVPISGTNLRREAAAQANTGQVDWLNTPAWARSLQVYFNPLAFAGTTPVATLSILGTDPISRDDSHAFKVAEHAALTGITAAGVNEVQTLNLTAGIATETFKLTFNTHESSAAVTLPTGGFANVTAAQIKACLLTISDWIDSTADIAVVKTSNAYAITFTGLLARTDLGAITVTSKVGAADGSVAATTAGVPGASLLVNVGPGVLGIADDVTNSATVFSVVNLASELPALVGVRLVLDRATADETYTYNLSASFRG